MTPDELQRFQAGDPVLVRSLVETLSPRLLGYAINLTGDRDEAEDLLQETWIQAYRGRASFRGEGPLLSWLISITYNRFVSDRRGEARRLAKRTEAGVAPRMTWTAAIAADDPSIDTRRALAAALAELPERQRAVFICRLMEDRSVRETALRLGVAEGTVKATLHQAIRSLRRLLKDWNP